MPTSRDTIPPTWTTGNGWPVGWKILDQGDELWCTRLGCEQPPLRAGDHVFVTGSPGELLCACCAAEAPSHVPPVTAPPPRRASRVGDVVVCHGKRCRVFKVRPLGTIDVEEIDGPGAWRISGLPMYGEAS